jgi:hypothetical protein
MLQLRGLRCVPPPCVDHTAMLAGVGVLTGSERAATTTDWVRKPTSSQRSAP